MPLLMTFALSFVLMGQAPQDTLQRAIRELRKDDFSTSKPKVASKRAAIAAIWAQGRGNASDALPDLLKHVRHHRVYSVWQDALGAACAIATPADTPLIIETLREQLCAVAEAESTGNHVLRQRLIGHATTVYSFFRRKCVPLLPSEGRGLPSLMELLTEFEVATDCRWTGWGSGISQVAMRLLPDDEARSQHLVQFVRRAGIDGQYDEQWGSLAQIRPYLNDIVKSGLRVVVQDSLQEGHAFNRMAAGILADWGDSQMLPILQQLQDVNGPEFAAKQIHMIEVQNPPQQLLQFIADNDPNVPQIEYDWAIQRATEIGMPREDILVALNLYCSRNLDSLEWRIHAVMRKSFAVYVGVIQPTEIPNIPYETRLANTQAQRDKQAAIWHWVEHGPNSEIPPNCDYIPFDFDEPVEPHTPPQIDAPFGEGLDSPYPNWQPNEANLEIMVEWMGTVDWDSIDNVEGIRMFSEKMCELDLIHPDRCEEFAAPNP